MPVVQAVNVSDEAALKQTAFVKLKNPVLTLS